MNHGAHGEKASVNEENLHRDNAAETLMRFVRDTIVFFLRALRVLRG
jgi:hypothetical protein